MGRAASMVWHGFSHVDLPGDRGGDHGVAIFAQPLNGFLGLGDNGVDPAGFAIEEVGDGALLWEGGTQVGTKPSAASVIAGYSIPTEPTDTAFVNGSL